MKKQRSGENFGGSYVPEMLVATLNQITDEFNKAKKDKKFIEELNAILKDFAGRPTPLVFANNLTKKLGGAKIYLKNEGLNHTGAHKITHCIGQAMIAKRIGKKVLIAETGAGQHGLATATVAAKMGFKCKIFMGETDILRQRPNVFFMEQLGAEVIPVRFGSKTLKDAVNESLRYWMQNLDEAHYVIGSVLGPCPYPEMNRFFQSVVGKEAKKQILVYEKRTPDHIIACVGGGSNAMGIFYEFLQNKKVELTAVEAGGIGKKIGENAAKSLAGTIGIAQGYKSLFLQDKNGQIAPTHSIAAGLDYPGLGPELTELKERRRVSFVTISDKDALKATKILAQEEGIIPALESAHAVAHAIKIAPKMSKNKVILVNISGRGDKDLFIVAKANNDKKFKDFLKKEYESYK